VSDSLTTTLEPICVLYEVSCLALYAVIAWRIVYATMLARALPDAPCTAVLADDEWQLTFF
jgi:hypothetical protein